MSIYSLSVLTKPVPVSELKLTVCSIGISTHALCHTHSHTHTHTVGMLNELTSDSTSSNPCSSTGAEWACPPEYISTSRGTKSLVSETATEHLLQSGNEQAKVIERVKRGKKRNRKGERDECVLLRLRQLLLPVDQWVEV